MRNVFVGLVCLLLSALPATADDWMDALIAFDDGRYTEALALLTPFAESGDLKAQEILYAMYSYGYGVPVDPAAAFGWLERSARLGSADAQEAMGQHYLDGIGVAADAAEAVRWFNLAAEQDHPGATYNLAVLTMNGRGVAADLEAARRLLERAADLDSPDALYVLGVSAIQNAPALGSIDPGLGLLARAAQLGQRQASAMLGWLLEDLPEVPDSVFKSAFHYQAALAAGCDDIAGEAARALTRLSPDEVEKLDYNLTVWLPERDPRDVQPAPGHCLTP